MSETSEAEKNYRVTKIYFIIIFILSLLVGVLLSVCMSQRKTIDDLTTIADSAIDRLVEIKEDVELINNYLDSTGILVGEEALLDEDSVIYSSSL